MAGGHCWRDRELASLNKLTPPILILFNTFLTEGFPLFPKSKMASQKNIKKYKPAGVGLTRNQQIQRKLRLRRKLASRCWVGPTQNSQNTQIFLFLGFALVGR